MQITLGNSHAPCTWPLHVTSPCDSCTWPWCSSTQFVELSRLNTSSRFRRKRNFFRAPKICSVSTWCITWLLPFTLSNPFDQLSVFVTRLTVLQTFFCKNKACSGLLLKNQSLNLLVFFSSSLLRLEDFLSIDQLSPQKSILGWYCWYFHLMRLFLRNCFSSSIFQ